jgi:quercetin dioxygenase-like cupin family protein
MSLDRTRADSQETLRVGAIGVRFLVEAADSNGSVSVFECFVPADSRMPAPHSHDAFEETIYGLEGVTSWTVDGRVVEIGVGDAFCVSRGAVHGFAVTSKFYEPRDNLVKVIVRICACSWRLRLGSSARPLSA